MGNFMVMDEKFEIKDGEVIAIFKIDNSNNKYILYSVSGENKNSCKLLVSYFKKDSDGQDYLESIEDDIERNKMINILKKVLRGDN